MVLFLTIFTYHVVDLWRTTYYTRRVCSRCRTGAMFLGRVESFNRAEVWNSLFLFMHLWESSHGAGSQDMARWYQLNSDNWLQLNRIHKLLPTTCFSGVRFVHSSQECFIHICILHTILRRSPSGSRGYTGAVRS